MKRKFGKAIRLVESYLSSTEELPDVLAGRIVAMVLIGILFLVIGVFVGCRLHELDFVVWSVVLAALVLGRCTVLIHTVKRYGFEVLEGKVEKVHEIPATGVCTVTLVLWDGQKIKLLLGTQRRIRMGVTYRFYFCKRGKSIVRRQQADIGTGNSMYLGCEEIGNKA